jgi:hypothetical protein
VSSPSDPQPPLGSPRSPQPPTQEIPVVQPAGATSAKQQQLPPHPAAAPPVQPPPVPVDAPQPTGPVDFVPGLPGLGTPPPPPPSAPSSPVWPETLESNAVEPGGPKKERLPRVPRNRGTLVGLGLAVLALVLLELGLVLAFDTESYWSLVPLWSAFATVCALLGLLAVAAFHQPGNRLHSGPAWRVGVGGLVGLAVFWLLVVLHVVASDRGFVLTAALAALGGALWIGLRQKD